MRIKSLFLLLFSIGLLNISMTQAQLVVKNDQNQLLMTVTNLGSVGIGTQNPTARLHIVKGQESEILRLEGISEKPANTRFLAVDQSGNVGFRHEGDFSAGEKINDSDILSKYNRNAYEIDTKTHDYLELYLLTSGQNDSNDGGRDEDDNGGVTVSHLQIQVWNGTSWSATQYYASRSVTCPDNDATQTDKFYIQWHIPDNVIAQGALIRFRVWSTNPPGQDNYHDTAKLGLRYWSHDGNHLNQSIIQTL